MKVEQIANNQFKVYTKEGVYFQSYDSVVAFKPYNNDKIRVGIDWDYNRTTMKYVGQFLGQNTAQTRRDILDGKIILDKELKLKD